ncbi:hypothetical protein SASPL_149655 [Salvia splendens]|uniref:Uncharacterized protein n=1 Tax=Salvia splendens TaxID=180675 RepID=A0A8X8WD79_SALSN|nr:hypothetical protein SASPL_149655 [Salvia splendens]
MIIDLLTGLPVSLSDTGDESSESTKTFCHSKVDLKRWVKLTMNLIRSPECTGKHHALVSLTGLVYIWAKDYTENWSAFAPYFKELEETEEYVEREDEIDLVPETEKVKDLGMNEDEDIDIMNTEGDSAFSDSDMSQGEIRFLPPDPWPDVPEIEDGLVVNTSKEGEISETESPLSDEAGQNGHLTNHESSRLEEDTGGMRLKRKRMPSEKFLDFETESIKKPPPKSKP